MPQQVTHSVRIQVKGNLPGYRPGQYVRVSTDANGTPLEEYWRRRFTDSEIDGCLEVVEDVQEHRPPAEPVTSTEYHPPKKPLHRRGSHLPADHQE